MALHLKSTGIDFADFSDHANMTSELLDDYEEGTWTAALNPESGSHSTDSNTMYYTTIGRLCNIWGAFAAGSAGGWNSLGIIGLPFGPYVTSAGSAQVYNWSSNVGHNVTMNIPPDGRAVVYGFNGTSNIDMAGYVTDGTIFRISATYPR